VAVCAESRIDAFVEHAIAVVVSVVADFFRSAENVGVRVVTVSSAAHAWRISVHVPIERVHDADAGCWSTPLVDGASIVVRAVLVGRAGAPHLAAAHGMAARPGGAECGDDLVSARADCNRARVGGAVDAVVALAVVRADRWTGIGARVALRATVGVDARPAGRERQGHEGGEYVSASHGLFLSHQRRGPAPATRFHLATEGLTNCMEAEEEGMEITHLLLLGLFDGWRALAGLCDSLLGPQLESSIKIAEIPNETSQRVVHDRTDLGEVFTEEFSKRSQLFMSLSIHVGEGRLWLLRSKTRVRERVCGREGRRQIRAQSVPLRTASNVVQQRIDVVPLDVPGPGRVP